MAQESEDGQEKTEEPTPKRREESRKKGQVPRSRELTTMLILLIAALAMLFLGGWMGNRLTSLLEWSFTFDRSHIFDPDIVIQRLHEAIGHGLITVIPFIAVMLAAALLAPTALGGWSFSFHPMAPKPEKLSPIKGFQRMFGTKAAVELGKALGKVLVIGGTAVGLFYLFFDNFHTMSRQPLEPAMAEGVRLFYIFFFLLALSMLVVVAIDIPYQIYDHTQKIRMTRQEVKDEHKQTEGKPEVKQRIRDQQREMANRRMMEQVPNADVVITNPAHFAVALQYDQQQMRAPKVVAKGTDLVASRIRSIAEENGILIFQSPPLARALYYSTELEQEIPAELYMAVAQVLAYVYQFQAAQRRGWERPERPDPEVPEGFDVDSDDAGYGRSAGRGETDNR
ncbi:flagellar biosynthesis protein FlhB [Halorhodospira halochloris]|uniref:Flagellar biosynthetic protein FlhB n=1 Tax=Halorhodospira halochloris TaxID=1052 RepID=A0A0X8XB81_HALHR|nr:flagellar biosynthesis protein FlhB [Halorhodospira halochloris]MBK1651829.1 flagellar biosynthesis protein FlhB [Halorhodospira halochloris]BAU58836.1 flagellar biosynthesis protein FlhB [Halorhodospira halochloris]